MSVKMNVVGGAVWQDGKLVPFFADKGDPGPVSTVPGPEGNDGWTPIFGGEEDGARTLIKVVDWAGGEGTKPQVGMYIGAAGYVSSKAAAFNFNKAKRVMPFSATTVASGLATINYSAMGFTTVPAIVPLPATTVALSGRTQTTLMSSPAPTKDSAVVKVEAAALVTGVLAALVGATANVLVIEQ